MKTLRIIPFVLLLGIITACHTSHQAENAPDALPAHDTSAIPVTNGRENHTNTADPSADAAPSSRMVKALDEALRDPLLTTSQLGLYVYDLTANRPLFAHGQRQRMRPASTMKVVTAVVALDLLGCDYTYKTSLYYSGKIDKSCATLQGNLYLCGTFDPLLSTADLRELVNTIVNSGIRKVSGNLYLDTTFKDDKPAGWGWCWDDKNPSLSALLVDGRDQAAGILASLLRKSGVRLQGRIKSGPLSSGATLLGTATHCIDQILLPMLKDSDNQMAESLFYQVAAQSGIQRAGHKEAADQSARLLDRIGISPENYTIADGSGLSLYNYVTAEMLVSLLRHASNDKRMYDTFLAALPVSGADGTLRNRMKGTSAEGTVQAKTGTVTGVSSLAGYTTATDGHRLAFAIINQGQVSARSARQFQDNICRILTSYPAD